MCQACKQVYPDLRDQKWALCVHVNQILHILHEMLTITDMATEHNTKLGESCVRLGQSLESESLLVSLESD